MLCANVEFHDEASVLFCAGAVKFNVAFFAVEEISDDVGSVTDALVEGGDEEACASFKSTSSHTSKAALNTGSPFPLKPVRVEVLM